MKKIVLAALMATMLTSAGHSQGPWRERQRAMRNQARLDPDRDLVDPLDDSESSLLAKAATMVGGLAMPFASIQASVSEILIRDANGQYDAAVQSIRRQMTDEDEALVEPTFFEATESDTLTYIDARELARLRLSRLPPSLREKFRVEIEPEAERLFKEAAASRSVVKLERLTRSHFGAHAADHARLLLGDMAFETGRFDDALAWWRSLAPLPSRAGPTSTVAFDLPRLRAKQILALIFLAKPAEAQRELRLFESLHPNAQGRFAGKTDRYAKILGDWLEERRPTFRDDFEQPWTTLGGDAGRNRGLAQAPTDRLWIDGPTWKTPLPAIPGRQAVQLPLGPARSIEIPESPYYPIIAEGQVLVNTGAAIESFDLLTGKAGFRFALPGFAEASVGHALSLTAAEGRVFGRFGEEDANLLVCLDLRADGALKWSTGVRIDDKLASFDGDPLVLGDRLYIAASRELNGRLHSYLVCFDLDGVEQWRTKMADYSDAKEVRGRAHLLVGADQAVVSVAHGGAVIAVDARSGRRLWALRYPSVESVAPPREASSALFADGRIFVAPIDSPKIFCIDAATGHVVWDRTWVMMPNDIVPGNRRASEVVHLFGVSDGRLIFTDRYRLQALDAATGQDVVWQQPSVGRLPGSGRGLIAGSWVFWPTADPRLSWRAVTTKEGSLRRSEPGVDPEYYEATTLRSLPAGNIALGQGCLVIAGAKEMTVFVPSAKQLPELKKEASLKAVDRYRLALALLDDGRPENAAAEFAALERKLSAEERGDWTALWRDRQTRPAPAPRPKETLDFPIPRRIEPPRVDGPFRLLKAAWAPIPGIAPPVEFSGAPATDAPACLVNFDTLTALDVRTGKPRWTKPLSWPGVQWIGQTNRMLIAAGGDGIEAWRVEDGRPAWKHHAKGPTRWALVDGKPERLSASGRFAAFAWIADRLACFDDQTRIHLLDADTGLPVRVFGGDLVAPLEGGLLRPFLDAIEVVERNGTPSIRFACRAVGDDEPIWSFAEAKRLRVELGSGRVFVGRFGGAVELTNPAVPGGVEWRHESPHRTSITGEAPQVFGHGKALLALMPLNQGRELTCFDPATGAPRWTLPPHLCHDGFDVSLALLDDGAVYYPYRNRLIARSLKDGRELWKLALPTGVGPWQVDRFGPSLLVWRRSFAGIPSVLAFADPLTAPCTVWFGRRGLAPLPILLIDPTTGGIRQRFDLPHDHGPVFAQVHGDRLIATAGGAVHGFTPD